MKQIDAIRGRISAPALLLALLFTVPAWAAAPREVSEKMAVAEASVQQANTTSTSENAALELQVATAKLINARRALDDKNYTLAEQLAEEVQVDARVAQLHAESERSRKAALESQNAAQALSEEINRPTAR